MAGVMRDVRDLPRNVASRNRRLGGILDKVRGARAGQSKPKKKKANKKSSMF